MSLRCDGRKSPCVKSIGFQDSGWKPSTKKIGSLNCLDKDQASDFSKIAAADKMLERLEIRETMVNIEMVIPASGRKYTLAELAELGVHNNMPGLFVPGL